MSDVPREGEYSLRCGVLQMPNMQRQREDTMSKECRHELIGHLISFMAVQEDRIRRQGWNGHYQGVRRGVQGDGNGFGAGSL